MAAFYTWRSGQAYPGETLYFWSPTGDLASSVTGYSYTPFDHNLTFFRPTRLYDNPNVWVMSVKISPSAVAGTVYTISWSTYSFNITVGTPPTSAMGPFTIPAGSTRAYIQSIITAGYSPITLSPGDYQLDTVLGNTSTTPVEIDGQGWASFTKLPEALSFHNRFFNVWGAVTLKGITFRGATLPNYGEEEEDYWVLAAYGIDPQPVDVNVIDCRFENCVLGQGYCEPDPDTDTGGVLIQNCEFVLAGIGNPPDGTVVNQCLFSGAWAPHAFSNYYSQKWLAINCDMVRTARGLVIGGAMNGVAAACRFFDIAYGAPNAGEVISIENPNPDPESTVITNNAFVWCLMYDCSGPGIELSGGQISANYFQYIFAHTKSASIFLNGYSNPITDNVFQNIEMTSNLLLTANCAGNSFSNIVALRNPLQSGNEVPGQPGWAFVQGGNLHWVPLPAFADNSTPTEGEPTNSYSYLYESRHDSMLGVFGFPSFGETPPE